jgi:hypothetical protein
LAFCYPILKDIGEGDMPKHSPAVTAHGKHGRKAEFFFINPFTLMDIRVRLSQKQLS